MNISLTLKLVYTESSVICEIQFKIFSLSTGSSSGGYHSWASVLINHDSLYLTVSSLASRESTFSCNLNSLKDLRRVVGFQLVQFYFLL